MAAKEWVGGNGDWNVADNWDPPGVPTIGDTVAINGGTPHLSAGTNARGTVTIGASGGMTIEAGANLGTSGLVNHGHVQIENGGRLSLSGDPSGPGFTNTGTIEIAEGGLLSLSIMTVTPSDLTDGITNAGTIELYAGARLDLGSGELALADVGTLAFGSGASVVNGTIVDDGSTAPTFGSAVFNGVTYQGQLDIVGIPGSLTIYNGLKVVNIDGTLPGTINISSGCSLSLYGTNIIDNVVINVVAGNLHAFPGTLTLGKDAVINIPSSPYGSTIQGNTINEGALNVSADFIFGGDLENRGHITVYSGGEFDDFGLVNNGDISVKSGGTLILRGSLDNSGEIDISAGGILKYNNIELDAAQMISGIVNAGTIVLEQGAKLDLDGGELALADVGPMKLDWNATITNGTIVDDGSVALALNAGTFDGVTYKGILDVSSGGSFFGGSLAVVNGLSVVSADGFSPGTINLAGTLRFLDEETIDKVTINFSPSSSIYAASGTTIFANETIVNVEFPYNGLLQGSFVNEGRFKVGGTLTLTGDFDNEGEVVISERGTFSDTDFSNGGRVTVEGALALQGGFTNTGSVDLQGGRLTLQGALTGSGTVSLTDGATVTLGAGTDAEQTVALVDGELRLVTPGAFAGTIDDFVDASDVVELVGIGYDVGDNVSLLNGNVLQIVQSDGSGTILLRLDLSQDYSAFSFHLSDDGAGGTDITVTCFCAGTLIATPGGERPVEDLAIGDAVVTASGDTRPVKWIGRQIVMPAFADPLRHYPICVGAGALAATIPTRDLYVSPDHALLVDGVLVQASALLNGASVQRVQPVAAFTYYHIELDDHALVLAEGAPAETFVDNVTRRHFDNYAEYQALFGHRAARITEMGLPRAKSVRQLPLVTRDRLAARAGALGLMVERPAA